MHTVHSTYKSLINFLADYGGEVVPIRPGANPVTPGQVAVLRRCDLFNRLIELGVMVLVEPPPPPKPKKVVKKVKTEKVEF